jgi:lantibiotic modifying enzyme
MTGWCHGSAGIGLSRMALGEIVLADHDAADHLCCGNAGACDFLLELARRCEDMGAHEAAPTTERRVPALGLFQGSSGIGWALLRAADDRLPSHLSWG